VDELDSGSVAKLLAAFLRQHRGKRSYWLQAGRRVEVHPIRSNLWSFMTPHSFSRSTLHAISDRVFVEHMSSMNRTPE